MQSSHTQGNQACSCEDTGTEAAMGCTKNFDGQGVCETGGRR